jgi:hypothetical protein
MMSKPLSNFGFLVLSMLLCLFPPGSDVCANVGSAAPSPLDGIIAVRLYGVRDGVPFQNTVVREEVADLDRLEVEGYVSGIVVFCEIPMRIQLEGHILSRLQKNADGAYNAGLPGSPAPRVQPLSIHENAYSDAVGPRRHVAGKGSVAPNVYAYFPQVPGGAVWSQGQFQLHFKAESMTTRLAVHQVGYRPEQLYHLKTRLPFQYHGTRFAELETHVPDLKQRLAAIGRGIAFVEEALCAALVSEIVILDYNAVKNAVTRKDRDAIWFYFETFRGEPIDELETIAAHETLHKYVDRRRLVRNSRIREQFSDMKGYGPLSLERFLMVSQGIVPSEDTTRGDAENLFFRFISEKHFIENRKGGHAGDDLDEFCTSFIHSMLHIHRLEDNLNRPIRRVDGFDRLMTGDEKQEILAAYVGTIEAFHAAVSDASHGSDAGLEDEALFFQGLARAQQIHGAGVSTASAADVQGR